MSALADALVAAQSRAVAALGKQYVAETLTASEVCEALQEIGLSDPADTQHWIAALGIIRATGAALPRENGARKDEPATEAQVNLIRSLADTKGCAMPTLPLTKAQAHEVIDTLKAGTYDAGKWAVPF